jgi:histidine phosphotransfer protein HptB
MTDAIDRKTFESLQTTAGADFVPELIDTFLAEAPRMLDELDAAKRDASAERFRRAAHSLKSNSYTFGALELGRMAKALELGGLASPGTGDVPTLAALRAEYARTAAALAALRGHKR